MENFDENSVELEKKAELEKTKFEEDLYFADLNSEDAILYQKMIALALNAHLSLNSATIQLILSRMKKAKNDEDFKSKGIVEKVVSIFVRDIAITDFEIARLTNQHAIEYYGKYLSEMRRRSLQQNIRYELEYFKWRKSSRDPYMFMGSSYSAAAKPMILIRLPMQLKTGILSGERTEACSSLHLLSHLSKPKTLIRSLKHI